MVVPAGQLPSRFLGPNKVFVAALINISPGDPNVLSGSFTPFHNVLPSWPFFPSLPDRPTAPVTPSAPSTPVLPAAPCAPRMIFLLPFGHCDESGWVRAVVFESTQIRYPPAGELSKPVASALMPPITKMAANKTIPDLLVCLKKKP